jgi:hypothetical protein
MEFSFSLYRHKRNTTNVESVSFHYFFFLHHSLVISNACLTTSVHTLLLCFVWRCQICRQMLETIRETALFSQSSLSGLLDYILASRTKGLKPNVSLLVGYVTFSQTELLRSWLQVQPRNQGESNSNVRRKKIGVLISASYTLKCGNACYHSVQSLLS